MNTPRLKVFLAHNYYVGRGGEDGSFNAEKHLLQNHGHELCEYTRANAEIESYSMKEYMSLPFRTVWAKDSYLAIRQLMSVEKPSIAHFNNIFPLISPAGYNACRELNIPVIQNLRNYRLLCPNALFFRDHHVCEDCLGRLFPWPSILHACYRNSRMQSLVVASMLAFHNFRDTWTNNVDIFIALTEFSRKKFVEGGLLAEKIVVRPNFIDDPGVAESLGNYALFVGRLDESKGILNLINAWEGCQNIPLKIVGDGPLKSSVYSLIEKLRLTNVELLGYRSPVEISGLMKNARFVVFPSVWYEGFPRVILESFSCGRAVVASNLGSSSELVDDGRTGLLFNPTNIEELSERINYLWDSRRLCLKLNHEARREYEMRYTPEIAYRSLTEIYERALSLRK